MDQDHASSDNAVRVGLATLGLLLATPLLLVATAGDLDFEPEILEFGELRLHESTTVSTRVTNRGPEPIEILGVRPADLLVSSPERLEPGASGELVLLARAKRLGVTSTRVFVRWRAQDELETRIALTGFASSDYLPETLKLDFGFVDRAEGSAIEARLSTTASTDLQIVSIDGVPASLDLRVEPDSSSGRSGVLLRAATRPEISLGRHTGVIEIRTNLVRQPLYPVRYDVTVYGAIRPWPNRLDLGTQMVGEAYSGRLELRHRDRAAFTILDVEDARGFLTGSVGQCRDSAQGCVELHLAADPVEPGYVSGTLRIETDNPRETVAVRYTALIVKSGARVEDLGQIAPSPPDPIPADERGAPEVPTQPAPPGTIRLRWSTLYEDGIYGYLVNRSDSPDGPFVRINETIVRTKGAEELVQSYDYIDREVERGRTYYYFVDSVSRHGVKAPLSGVLSRTLEME